MENDNINGKDEESNHPEIKDEKESEEIKETEEPEGSKNIEEESENYEYEETVINKEILDETEEKIVECNIIDEDEDIKEDDINYNSEKEGKAKGDNKEDIHSKNKNKKIVVSAIIGLVILMLITINYTVSKYDGIAYPGTYIYGEDVSSLNKSELNKRINGFKNTIDEKIVNIKAGGKSYDLKMKDIVLTYNEDKLSEEVLGINNNKNTLQKFISIIRNKKLEYKLDIDLKEDIIKEKGVKISEETSKGCIEPRVIINGNDIKYEDGKKGIKLDIKEFLLTLEKYIKDNNIYKDDIKISAIYRDDNPKINIIDLKKINYKISTYSTTYGTGGGRGRNVEIAAKKIDNLLLMPGEEFSYEKSVGPVIESNGYTYAPVISNGELVPGIGGGVCQVSSTLYNTQLKAGLLPTERRNHSKPVSYVPRGLDATMASGSIDYKFKNTYEDPIVINTNTSGGKLTIEFWSNKDTLKGIEYKPVGYASGKTANSYLYGYDKDGNKVYEKHIDTSIYR